MEEKWNDHVINIEAVGNLSQVNDGGMIEEHSKGPPEVRQTGPSDQPKCKECEARSFPDNGEGVFVGIKFERIQDDCGKKSCQEQPISGENFFQPVRFVHA